MNTTILNKKEAEILETLLAEYGEIVSSTTIFSRFEGVYSKSYLKKMIVKLVDRGWLVRLKKGTYLITNLDTRGYVGVSQYLVANSLVVESYVSFGLALQYYGMFDQLLSTVSSISTKRHKTTLIQGINYRYIFTSNDYFYGWDTVRVGGHDVRIASKEKALIDMLQFHRSLVSVDMVIEKLLNHKDEIDNKKLIEFAKRSTVSVQRLLGFILDIVGLDASDLEVNDSAVKMTAESDQFNAKWRLYYDQHFNQYI